MGRGQRGDGHHKTSSFEKEWRHRLFFFAFLLFFCNFLFADERLRLPDDETCLLLPFDELDLAELPFDEVMGLGWFPRSAGQC
jgi:hypothetical protein